MGKLYNLDEWERDPKISDTKRNVDVSIVFKYPDPKPLMEFKPKERIKKISKYQKDCLKQLLALKLFEEFELNGTERRPRGVKVKVKFDHLDLLQKSDFIDSIWIESVDYAVKKEGAIMAEKRYYCIKMTVVIEIEGIKLKKESIEKRFVLIKADSFDDAYEKVKKQKVDYAEPYLNSDGRLVTWRIDSFDDCYATDITRALDLDKPEGVEVYSKLSSRKASKK